MPPAAGAAGEGATTARFRRLLFNAGNLDLARLGSLGDPLLEESPLLLVLGDVVLGFDTLDEGLVIITRTSWLQIALLAAILWRVW